MIPRNAAQAAAGGVSPNDMGLGPPAAPRASDGRTGVLPAGLAVVVRPVQSLAWWEPGRWASWAVQPPGWPVVGEIGRVPGWQIVQAAGGWLVGIPDHQESANIPRCPACQSDELWSDCHGATRCAVCDPPPAPAVWRAWIVAGQVAMTARDVAECQKAKGVDFSLRVYEGIAAGEAAAAGDGGPPPGWQPGRWSHVARGGWVEDWRGEDLVAIARQQTSWGAVVAPGAVDRRWPDDSGGALPEVAQRRDPAACPRCGGAAAVAVPARDGAWRRLDCAHCGSTVRFDTAPK